MADPFDNDWDNVAALPSERFTSVPFREIYDRSGSWELPNKWSYVVRVEDPQAHTIVEKAFTTLGAAERMINRAENSGHHVTYYNAETMITTLNVDKDEEAGP